MTAPRPPADRRPPAEPPDPGRSPAALEAFDEATRAIVSVLSIDRVLQLIVDRVRELVGARYAALGIVDAEGQIEQFVTSGMSRAERARIGAPPRGLGILGLIVREGRSFRIADIAIDPRRHGFPPGHPEMHAFLGVPVQYRGRTIGNLYLTERLGGFSAEDQALVEAFARHAAIAMENARLHEQVQRLAIVEERERIGKDLHDGIIQAIYAVGLSLEDVPELMDEEPDEARARVERATEALDQTIRDIRNFIFGLRPQLIDGLDLVEGLAALADEFRVNTMVDVEFHADREAHEVALGADRTLELLTISREALSNIARHARATRATVRLSGTADGLDLEIVDNGVGFDPGVPRSLGHQGLRNIRARAIAIGATPIVDSEPGAGTRIILRVPSSPAGEHAGPEEG
jgi:signal transduction histidine kinase